MNYHFINTSFIYLLTLPLLVLFCNGQVKTGLPKKSAVEQLSFTSRQPKLTSTQGTTQENVHCGLQDKAGNLWFGTTGEGVYCYDGKLFTQFTEQDGLSNNKVWSILEDTSGNIWFGTNNGISRYDGKTISAISMHVNNSFDLFPNNPAKNTSFPGNAVWSILQDKNGIIWFGTDYGVYCYNGKRFYRFLDNPGIINKSGLPLKSVQCMFEDKNGNLWFGSGPMAFEGIVFYDGKNLTSFKPQKEGWIRTITEDKNGTLLFDTRHIDLVTYDGKTFSDFSQP